jgi:hypothetical protein
MAKKLSLKVRGLLDKSIDSATQAISIYNNPRSTFRTGNFAVLMIIAWTSLCHAFFEREKINYFYREKNGRYKKINGYKQSWGLSDCIKHIFDQSNPVYKNLELFIIIRNKIEHTNLPALDDEVVGENQALVLNFENWLIKEFGEKYALVNSLFVPIQLTGSIKHLQPVSKDEKSIIQFVKDYRATLDLNVKDSIQYSFRVFLTPKVGNHQKSSNLTLEFVKPDQIDSQDMKKYDRGVVAVKEKLISVVNMNYFKPSVVLNKLNEQGHSKNMHWHTTMWKKYKIRPASKADDKSSCESAYCMYDEVHNDYVYTDAWVKFLLKEELNNPSVQ